MSRHAYFVVRVMDEEEYEHLIELRNAYKKRLHQLELYKANFGYHTEPHIETEIDEINTQIEYLSRKIFSLNNKKYTDYDIDYDKDIFTVIAFNRYYKILLPIIVILIISFTIRVLSENHISNAKDIIVGSLIMSFFVSLTIFSFYRPTRKANISDFWKSVWIVIEVVLFGMFIIEMLLEVSSISQNGFIEKLQIIIVFYCLACCLLAVIFEILYWISKRK